jgi:hypothetical protein
MAENKFPSLSPSGSRLVMTVSETAHAWRVSDQHIIDLLDEGKLNGFNISGRYDYLRVPVKAIHEIASLSGVPVDQVLRVIGQVKSLPNKHRAHWRIPIIEGYSAFIQDNRR